MSSVSSSLKSHSQSQASAVRTIVSATESAPLIKSASSINNDISLAAHHPLSDDTTSFTGLAVLNQGGDLVHFRYQPRKLGELDVEVSIEYCGVCASDLHSMDNGWGFTKYPIIAGHEIVGRVAQVGSKVSRLKVGQIVAVGTEVLTCGKCHDCTHHDDAYCKNAVLTYASNYADGQWSFGGYQNAIRVHEEWVFPVPPSLDPASAAPLLCAGVTVFAPLLRHYSSGMSVGVVGIGGLGHLALQFASKMGAPVTAISTSTRKRDDAMQLFGATHFLLSTDDAAMQAAASSLDLIIVTANPDNLSLDPFITLLKTGGRIVVVAAPETPLKFSCFGMLMKRAHISGSAVGSKWEVAAALEFAAKHGVKPVIEKFPISQASDAIQKVRQNSIRFRAVLQLPLPK